TAQAARAVPTASTQHAARSMTSPPGRRKGWPIRACVAEGARFHWTGTVRPLCLSTTRLFGQIDPGSTSMSLLDRRQSFKALLAGLLGTAGTVVLARALLPARAAAGTTGKGTEGAGKGLQERADRVADAGADGDEAEGQEPCSFLNGSATTSSFHNGGFTN